MRSPPSTATPATANTDVADKTRECPRDGHASVEGYHSEGYLCERSESAAVEVARRLLDDRRGRLHGLLGGVELLPEFGQVGTALEVGN